MKNKPDFYEELLDKIGIDELLEEGRRCKSSFGLKRTLERDKNGKPKLKLIFSKSKMEMGINIPTQKDLDTLMQVYECGGWKWYSGRKPTTFYYWGKFADKTTILWDNDFIYGSKFLAAKIISPQEFYDLQDPKITPGMIKEINKWFDANKPSRASKG